MVRLGLEANAAPWASKAHQVTQVQLARKVFQAFKVMLGLKGLTDKTEPVAAIMLWMVVSLFHVTMGQLRGSIMVKAGNTVKTDKMVQMGKTVPTASIVLAMFRMGVPSSVAPTAFLAISATVVMALMAPLVRRKPWMVAFESIVAII